MHPLCATCQARARAPLGVWRWRYQLAFAALILLILAVAAASVVGPFAGSSYRAKTLPLLESLMRLQADLDNNTDIETLSSHLSATLLQEEQWERTLQRRESCRTSALALRSAANRYSVQPLFLEIEQLGATASNRVVVEQSLSLAQGNLREAKRLLDEARSSIDKGD